MIDYRFIWPIRWVYCTWKYFMLRHIHLRESGWNRPLIPIPSIIYYDFLRLENLYGCRPEEMIDKEMTKRIKKGGLS